MLQPVHGWVFIPSKGIDFGWIHDKVVMCCKDFVLDFWVQTKSLYWMSEGARSGNLPTMVAREWPHQIEASVLYVMSRSELLNGNLQDRPASVVSQMRVLYSQIRS